MKRPRTPSAELVAKALVLAETGKFEYLYEIERKLIADGFADATFLSADASVRKRLREILRSCRLQLSPARATKSK